MSDQTVRNWTRRELSTADALVKVPPGMTATILINGAGTCDVVGYLVKALAGETVAARNNHVIATGVTGDNAYNAIAGFAEVGVENVVGLIDLEVARA